MAGENLSGNGYSPLPQSISNTDSEDEDEHLTRPNHTIQRESDDTTIMDSLHKNGQFHPLDESQNLANRMRNGRSSLGYCSDNIPIMVLDGEAHDLWKPRDMSPLRRICLVFSILLCILTTLIFLYVLPCDNSAICSEVSEPKSSLSWEKTLEGIELQGPISIVPEKPANLIFLLRGQKFGKTNSQPTGLKIPPEGGGVLSMKGTTGIPLWWTQGHKEVPTDINCRTLDTNSSEKPDCIVVGEQGFLESIKSTTGIVRWMSKIRTYSRLPVFLPDVDLDGINDLLSVEISTKPKVKLVLISGGSGNLLGTYPIPDCEVVHLYGLDSNSSISYFCTSANGKETTESLSLEELLSSVNLSRVQRKLGIASKSLFSNETPLNQKTDIWNLSSIYRLYVQNQGVCPGEQCQVNVNITVQNQNETRVIWDHFSSGSFVSIPAILNKTAEPLKTAGCVLKFWHWPTSDVGNQASSESGIVRRILTERVLMILINHPDFRVINASQSEVIQFCRKDDCQPSLELQTKSIAVVDLDGDGSSELISYQSSYDGENSQVLTSKVQVVKLDAVLETKS